MNKYQDISVTIKPYFFINFGKENNIGTVFPQTSKQKRKCRVT